MEDKLKILERAKTLFSELKTHPNSFLFSVRELDSRRFKKLKKSTYAKDKQLLKLITLAENAVEKLKEEELPTRIDYVEKREIDRPRLYSFNGPFQLIHADVANLQFLRKFASVPRYALLIVDLYSSKVYVYPMRSRKQIAKKLGQFYIDVQKKRKNKNMRLQVDNEFQQVKIPDLNDKFNVTMFTTSVRGGKAFAGEEKIRELKVRVSKIKAISDEQKAKVPAVTIIQKSAENMNAMKSQKHGISPDEVEEKYLSSQRFRVLFNFKRIERSRAVSDRLDRYDRKEYTAKRTKLRSDVQIGKKVLVLERIKKKSASGKFYKQTVQNIPYFNKKAIFAIRKKQTIDKKAYY